MPAAAVAARLGMLRLAPGQVTLRADGGFIGLLEQTLGTEVAVSVHLGPPRANRKPVFHIIEPRSGRSLAYAKLGINELTCRRVRDEAAALSRLGAVSTGRLRVPALIAAGQWEGLDYLVMKPLTADSPAPASPELRAAAGTDLVGAFARRTCALQTTDWWSRMWQALADDRLPRGEADRLEAVASRLAASHGDRPLVLGAVHGDWSPWNMCAQGDSLAVWDWERFATDLPVGWDEIHYRLGSHRDGPAAAVCDPDAILSGLASPTSGEVLLATYLINQGVNHLIDRQREAGARTGDIRRWLLPALEALVEPLARPQAPS
ncbi:MAG: phosphotransferase [Actinomycetia bacterium]|nr:phosphotransferase [Actinomycetes bacterium]